MFKQIKEAVKTTIGDRIKLVRKELDLTQAAFAEKIGLKATAIGLYESGDRTVTERSIVTICSEFNVNEEWLRNGTGEMFSESRKSVFEELTQQFNLDTIQQAFVETILQMNDLDRRVLKSLAHNLVDKLLSEENYEEFRAGYIKENAAPMAARDGDISGLAEAAALYDAAMEDDDED